MTQEQNHQELVDLKVLLKECFIAEYELASFLLDKAKATEFPVDDTFKLKHLVDRVNEWIRQIQASDEGYHHDYKDDSDDNVPKPLALVPLAWCAIKSRWPIP